MCAEYVDRVGSEGRLEVTDQNASLRWGDKAFAGVAEALAFFFLVDASPLDVSLLRLPMMRAASRRVSAASIAKLFSKWPPSPAAGERLQSRCRDGAVLSH